MRMCAVSLDSVEGVHCQLMLEQTHKQTSKFLNSKIHGANFPLQPKGGRGRSSFIPDADRQINQLKPIRLHGSWCHAHRGQGAIRFGMLKPDLGMKQVEWQNPFVVG